MEQRFASILRNLLTYSLLLGCTVVLSACKEPVPNPELRDPIYADLGAQEKATATDIEAEKKSIEELKTTIAKAPVRSAEKKHSERELVKREKKLSQLKQMDEYYVIRLEQRKTYVEKDYMRAYEADLPWPDPKEYDQYKAVRKLQTASRNWDARVPKTTRYMKNPPPGGPGEKKEAKKEEGGEKPAVGGHE